MQLIYTAAIASFAFFLLYHVLGHIYGLFFSPHRSIPGPFLARFTKLYYFYVVYLGRFEWLNIALHKRYRSPIVRVAPNWYSISDPTALKTIYGAGSKFVKSDWYYGWQHPDPSRFSLFSDRDAQRHAQDRKKYSAMYSMSALVSYESYVEECTGIFSERLKEFASSGSALDMTHWFQCYAFDVIGDITYSNRFGFLDSGEDVGGVISALESSMIFSTLAGIYAGIYPTMFKIAEMLGASGARGRTFLVGFGEKMLRVRKEEESLRVRGDMDKDIEVLEEDESDQPTDMLGKFLNDLYGGKPGWTMRNVLAMTTSNIIAGSDTTAVSLSAILYYLLKYPQTMQKLRAEIQEFERKGECGKSNVSFKESQNMPYLQAVIKEALRLHPATGLPLWRIVPEGGAEICGHRFKGGEIVGANSWVIQYDENVFEEADVFKPERWLQKDGEKSRAMDRSYMPFGLGSRTCIGKNVSMLEMCKLIPQLVRRFEFHLEKPDKPWKTANYWFVKQLDFKVKVNLRK